jgi:hypothetical protein
MFEYYCKRHKPIKDYSCHTHTYLVTRLLVDCALFRRAPHPKITSM